jgi:hypothetical protein
MARQVDIEEMQPSDTLLFQGTDSVFKFFSFFLTIFEPVWRQWKKARWLPWHCAKAWIKGYQAWGILEATAEGMRLNWYSIAELKKHARAYRLFETPPPPDQMDVFLKEIIGKPYDVAIYFWTSLQYLIRHYFNHRIPRLLDDRYTCWEGNEKFDSEFGKPWGSPYDCVMITDFMKTVEGD